MRLASRRFARFFGALPWFWAWLGFSGLLGLSACTHYVGRGSDLYYQGRYIEAAHVLEKTEPRLVTASFVEQAAYGLYRGATLLRLGDLAGAGRWLEYCNQLHVKHPAALEPGERDLLYETLLALRADLDRRAAAAGF
jgi:hypothetical protein